MYWVGKLWPREWSTVKYAVDRTAIFSPLYSKFDLQVDMFSGDFIDLTKSSQNGQIYRRPKPVHKHTPPHPYEWYRTVFYTVHSTKTLQIKILIGIYLAHKG